MTSESVIPGQYDHIARQCTHCGDVGPFRRPAKSCDPFRCVRCNQPERYAERERDEAQRERVAAETALSAVQAEVVRLRAELDRERQARRELVAAVDAFAACEHGLEYADPAIARTYSRMLAARAALPSPVEPTTDSGDQS